MKQAVEISRQAVEISQQTLIVSQRAYITVQSLKLEGIEVTVGLGNTGKVPATNVRGHVIVAAFNGCCISSFPHTWIMEPSTFNWGETEIPPSSFDFPVLCLLPVTNEALKEIQDREWEVMVAGDFEYQDGFNQSQRTVRFSLCGR